MPHFKVLLSKFTIARMIFEGLLVDTTQVQKDEYNRTIQTIKAIYIQHRYMPFCTLTINVDLWATNTDTKLSIRTNICFV